MGWIEGPNAEECVFAELSSSHPLSQKTTSPRYSSLEISYVWEIIAQLKLKQANKGDICADVLGKFTFHIKILAFI